MTSVKNRILEFESLGIHLYADGEKLRYKASKERMSPEIIAELKAHKAELLEALQTKDAAISLTVDRANRFEPFPLTDVQSAYLMGRGNLFEYGGVSCHVYLELKYQDLETPKVKEIWNKLVQKYDMLHAVIDEGGFQQVLEHFPALDVPEWDLVQNPERTEDYETFRKEFGDNAFPIGKFPMFGLAVSRHKDFCILHLSIEFLIADWTSIWKLVAEFEDAYFAGKDISGEEKISFRDYLVAEKKIRSTAQYEKEKKYWLDQIQTLPEAPELPTLPASKLKNTFARKTLRLNSDEWERLKATSKRLGLTPTIPILTAYSDVLSKWSRNKKFCINMTVLNRLPLHENVMDIIGDFTSLDLLKIDNSPTKNFVERAQAVNARLFEDLDNRLFSGVEVMRTLAKNRKKSGISMPIVYTSAIGLADSGASLRGEFIGGISQTPQTFIDCQVMDGGFGLQVNWDYRKGVFPESVLDSMFEAFERRLKSLAQEDFAWEEMPAVSLPKTCAAEQDAANATQKAWNVRMLQSDFLKNVKKYSEKIAVDDGQIKFTFKELNDRAKVLAKKLIDCGVKPQDLVPVLMKKSAWQVVAVLGILYAGAVYVPIAASKARGRAEKIIRKSGAKVAIGISSDEKILEQELVMIAVDNLDRNCDVIDQALFPKRTPDDIAYIIYTSGSTGEPKGVVISHKGAMNTIDDMNDRFDVGANDAVLGLSQLNFDLSVYDIFGVLGAGGTLIFPTAEDYMNPEIWEKLICEKRITVWNSVPALMRILLDHVEKKNSLRKLPFKNIFLSGDWIPLDMPSRIQKISEARVVCLGGATEASIWSNFHVYNSADNLNILPYGKPLANQTMHILDANMEFCPTMVTGQIALGGDGVALGYYLDKDRTDAQFVILPKTGERVYLTGDIGRYLPGGEIEFLGREDTQVKIRGHRIELGEIESVLKDCPNVRDAVSVVSEDKREIYSIIVPSKASSQRIQKASEKFLTREKYVSNFMQECIEDVNFDQINTGYAEEEKACVYSILLEFQNLGLFKKGKAYQLEELKSKILPKYHWLLTRWIQFLLEQNFIHASGGSYICDFDATENEKETLWKKADAAWNGNLISKDFLEYVKINGDHLAEIMQGKEDQANFLYAKTGDKFRYVDSLYVKNKMIEIANRTLIKYLENLFKENPERRIRILEVGAGTGSLTRRLLPILKGHSFEYLFTDYLAHFFPTAAERFCEYPELKFKQLDLNDDFTKQGLLPNSFDLIVGAYVMNNVSDLKKTLTQMEIVAAPGAYWMFLEPYEQSAWMTITQATLMDVPANDLQKQKQIFDQLKMSADKWKQELSLEKSIGNVSVFPNNEKAMEQLHLMFLVRQVKTELLPIHEETLKSHMDKYLLHYMHPSSLLTLDALPLSANGKIDRKAILQMFEQNKANGKFKKTNSVQMNAGSIEDKISKIVAKALNIESIGYEDNFYDFGADSLLMAQMVTSIRNDLAQDKTFDALLKQMLDFPTVKDVAKFLSGEISHKNKTQNDFIQLQRFGDSKNKTARILLPTVLWSADMFREIIPLLDKQDEGEIFIFKLTQPKVFLEFKPSEVASELVRAFAEKILHSGVQNIQIIGYSFNGKLALELAERLEEMNLKVTDLAIIDGARIPFESKTVLLRDLFFSELIHIDSEKMGFNSNEIAKQMKIYLAEKQKKVLTEDDFKASIKNSHQADYILKFFNLSEDERCNRIKQCSQNYMEQMSDEAFRELKKIFDQNFGILLNFNPVPYFGNLRCLNADNKQGSLKNLKDWIDWNWDDLCIEQVRYEQIQGDHFSAFTKKDDAIDLAKHLSMKNLQEFA